MLWKFGGEFLDYFLFRKIIFQVTTSFKFRENSWFCIRKSWAGFYDFVTERNCVAWAANGNIQLTNFISHDPSFPFPSRKYFVEYFTWFYLNKSPHSQLSSVFTEKLEFYELYFRKENRAVCVWDWAFKVDIIRAYYTLH